MIIIVKMRRRGFVMLVLFCLNCRRRKVPPPPPCIGIGIEWERERLTHPSARTTAARGEVIVREGKKEKTAAQEKEESIGYFIKYSANTQKISNWLLLHLLILLNSILLFIVNSELLFLFWYYFCFFFRMLPSRLRPYYYTRNSFFVLLFLSPNSILQSILV